VRFGRIDPVDTSAEPDRPTFTGDVWREAVLEAGAGASVNHVRFDPGGRTHWHSHEGGQLLIVVDGAGHVGSRDGSRRAIGPGDVVWTDPGEEHWHGADRDRALAHVAVTLGPIDWMEPVADSDYDGP
jgi:quercetin dioxygenase-like cupin family protein